VSRDRGDAWARARKKVAAAGALGLKRKMADLELKISR
jgi:hypothetical protein